MQTKLSTERARKLRAESTDAEKRLWECLRSRRLGGWKWRRQTPVGPYIVDFYCPAAGLVVELDGGQHAQEKAEAYDARRTAYLRDQGLKVLRFWNSTVLEDDGYGVHGTILNACGGPLLLSSRNGGRGRVRGA